MTSLINHNLIAPAYFPYLNTKIDKNYLNLSLHDYYSEVFQDLGLTRYEAMIVLQHYMTHDPLTNK